MIADESRGGIWHEISLRVLIFGIFASVFSPSAKIRFRERKFPQTFFSAKMYTTCEIMHTNISCKILVPFIRKRLFRSETKLEGYVSSCCFTGRLHHS